MSLDLSSHWIVNNNYLFCVISTLSLETITLLGDILTLPHFLYFRILHTPRKYERRWKCVIFTRPINNTLTPNLWQHAIGGSLHLWNMTFHFLFWDTVVFLWRRCCPSLRKKEYNPQDTKYPDNWKRTEFLSTLFSRTNNQILIAQCTLECTVLSWKLNFPRIITCQVFHVLAN